MIPPREAAARRFPFLPRDAYLGWTPYAWLIYLPFFLIEPVLRTRAGVASAWYWAGTVLGVAVFLVAYFRGYWVRDRALLAVIAAIAGLGVVFAPFNRGSSAFFIYAACFAAQLHPSGRAVRTILLITAAGLVTSLLTRPPTYFWLTSVILAPVLGMVLLHYAQIERGNRQLLRAQDEIMMLARVAERERIARDLHDVLGHTLSLIVLKAELAGKLASRDPQRAAQEIRDVELVARQALRDVRETIRGYRATFADELARARSMLRVAGIDCGARVDECALDRPREEALALALREAVTNVVRHSGATHCRIHLERGDEQYTLEVQDDGVGGALLEGAGLRGMRERVEALGGMLALARAPDSTGTLLRVTTPVPSTAAIPIRTAAV